MHAWLKLSLAIAIYPCIVLLLTFHCELWQPLERTCHQMLPLVV